MKIKIARIISYGLYPSYIVIEDEKGKEYRINSEELEGVLKGKEIKKTEMARIYEHITEIE